MAAASDGKPPYTFQWAGKPTGPSAFYMYVALTAAGRTETVTVTDAADPRGKATDTAKILPPPTSNAPSGAAGSAALEVPRGGELYLVWGQGGDVTARSEDTAVVTVDVSSRRSGFPGSARAKRTWSSSPRRVTKSICR